VTYFALGHCHNPTIRAASSATPRHHNAHFSKPAVFDLDGADDQHLPRRLHPPPPVTGSFLVRQAISVSSTSTRPVSGLRPGARMLQRSMARINHAVL